MTRASHRIASHRIAGVLRVFATTCGLGLTGCDPPRARDALLAVHDGVEWRSVVAGTTITTYRDNPPLTGHLSGDRLRVTVLPSDSVFYYQVGSFFANWVWSGEDWWITTEGESWRDPFNPDGLIGLRHLGALPMPGSTGILALRWQANGLRLRPGVPTRIALQHQHFVGAPYEGGWRRDTEASGTLVLDSGTRLVGVSVVKVLLDEQQDFNFNQRLAELWFDGRAVGRREHAISAGGSSSTALNDFDPRPLWRFEDFDDPEAGRNAGAYMQEIDPIWATCGRASVETSSFVSFGIGRLCSTTTCIGSAT